MLEWTKVRVLDNLVLVRQLAEPERTEGGLFKPETSRERPQLGVVLAVGPGAMLDAGYRTVVDVLPGQVVAFTRFAGFAVDEASALLMIRENEIGGAFYPEDALVIRHEDGRKWHLAGDYCELCLAPEVDAAKARLAAMRAELVGHHDQPMNVREAPLTGLDDGPPNSIVQDDGSIPS